MYKKFYGEKPHELTAAAFLNVGNAHSDLGEFKEGFWHIEQALAMYGVLHGEYTHKDTAVALFCAGRACFYLSSFQKSLNYYKQALAVCKRVVLKNQLDRHPTSYLYGQIQAAQGDVYKALGRYEKARICYEKASGIGKKLGHYDIDVAAYHVIGNLYHLAALGACKEKVRHKHLNKANEAFEAGVAASDASSTALLVDYANFLLTIGKHKQAYTYLIRVIASGNDGEMLGCSLAEQATVPPTLQARIRQDKTVTVRAIDYAFYLLLHHYKAFQQAGITPEQTQEAYLAAYAQGIEARAGQPGKEKQDALTSYLLDSLQNAESVS